MTAIPPKAKGTDRPAPHLDPATLTQTSALEFPIGVLPNAIRDWALALSHLTQAPVALTATLGLGVLMLACQRGRSVYVARGWEEPIVGQFLIISPPTTLKTVTFRAAMRPMSQWGRDERKRYSNDLKRVDEQVKIRVDADDLGESDAAKLRKKLIAEIKPARRLSAADITPEMLARRLGQQGSLCIAGSDSSVLMNFAGRYAGGSQGGGDNLDTLLDGYDGAPMQFSRVGGPGGMVDIEADSARVGLMLMGQHSVLTSIRKAKVFEARGLTARLRFVVLPAATKAPMLYPSLIAPDIDKAYFDLITRAINDSETIAESAGDNACQEGTLRLRDCVPRPNGWSVPDWFHTLLSRVNHGKIMGGEFDDMAEWAGRMPGFMARAIAILEEYGGGGTDEDKACLVDYFVSHYRRAMGGSTSAVSHETEDESLVYIVKRLITHTTKVVGVGSAPPLSTRTFTLRDMMRIINQRRFGSSEALMPHLERMVELGWLIEVPNEEASKVEHKRAKRVYELNATCCRPEFLAAHEQAPLMTQKVQLVTEDPWAFDAQDGLDHAR